MWLPVLLAVFAKSFYSTEGLPPYFRILVCAVLLAASFTVFTVLVKNIKAKKVENAKGLEAIDGD